VQTESIEHLTIEKIVNKGYGIGYWQNHTVFVSHAIPGDEVSVRVIGKKGNSLFAEIQSYHRQSPITIEPSCDAFGSCGGCDWLNVPYEVQLEWKQNIVAEIYNRIYPSEQIRQIIGANPDRNYRNKVFMPIGEKGDEPIIGMYARKSHEVIPHEHCSLHPAFFDDIFSLLHSHIIAANIPIYNEKKNSGILKHVGIRYSASTGEVIVVLVTRGRKLPFAEVLVKNLLKVNPNIVGVVQNIKPDAGNRILGDEEKILYGVPYIRDRIKDTQFQLNYQSFMQIHPNQAENLVTYLDEIIPPGKNVVDAFSGIGFLGLSLASKCNWVYLIESNEYAVEDTKQNARLNEMNNITCISGKVEDELPQLVTSHSLDTMIFDPPRKGLEPAVIPVIASVGIPRIIYVSCNPSTQYRDIVSFMEHGYVIKEIQPFDLFPQTWHVENVVTLERQG